MNQRMPLGEKGDSYLPYQLLFAPLRSVLAPFAKQRSSSLRKLEQETRGRREGGKGLRRTPHQIAAHKAEN